VLAYLRRQITDEAFLSKADNRGEETEARAYVGIRASLGGRREDAVRHLGWVKDRGAREYTEHAMAVWELTRLETAATGGK
jgi:hypothetical protein